MSDVEKGQRVSKYLGLGAFLATAALLGKGQDPLSYQCIAAVATIGLSAIVNVKLQEFHKKFNYEPWSQADLD